MRIPLVVWTVGFCLGMGSALSAATLSAELENLVRQNGGYGGGVVRAEGMASAAGRLTGKDSAMMTPSTPFECASVTKMVTAAAVLQWVEQGKVALDRPASAFLPPDVAGWFHPAITVRQLLSHTSGLPDYWDSRAFLKKFLASPARRWTPRELLDEARRMKAGRPGSAHRYSDTNYVLLGLLVERASGLPLYRAFREKIFTPLEMNSTWMAFDEPARSPGLSTRYEGREALTGVPRQSADWAGGGLATTAADLEKFVNALFRGQLFRDPSTLREMLRTVPTGQRGISYGLGIYKIDLGGGRGELVGHDGHGNAFAYYWPQRGISLTGTLNQTDNDWWPLAEALMAR